MKKKIITCYDTGSIKKDKNSFQKTKKRFVAEIKVCIDLNI